MTSRYLPATWQPHIVIGMILIGTFAWLAAVDWLAVPAIWYKKKYE
jgi:hypothetical protein